MFPLVCAYLWLDYLLDDDTEIKVAKTKLRVKLASVPYFWLHESILFFVCSLLRTSFGRRDTS